MKYLQNATAVANYSIAIDREISKAKKEEFAARGKQTADFIPIKQTNKINDTNKIAEIYYLEIKTIDNIYLMLLLSLKKIIY